jgi:hypothetical protein
MKPSSNPILKELGAGRTRIPNLFNVFALHMLQDMVLVVTGIGTLDAVPLCIYLGQLSLDQLVNI